VVLGEKKQRSAVNLLLAEVLRILGANFDRVDKVDHLVYGPPGHVAPGRRSSRRAQGAGGREATEGGVGRDVGHRRFVILHVDVNVARHRKLHVFVGG